MFELIQRGDRLPSDLSTGLRRTLGALRVMSPPKLIASWRYFSGTPALLLRTHATSIALLARRPIVHGAVV